MVRVSPERYRNSGCHRGAAALVLSYTLGWTSVSAQVPLFTEAQVWNSADPYVTRATAWGDVDRDGDLDLVCANEGPGQQSLLFVNVGGILSSLPAWDGHGSANAVALGDVDRDGDLDVVFGGFNQFIALYANEDGIFENRAAWVSSVPAHTRGVTLADFDGDGDLDLAIANDGQKKQLYENVNSWFGGSPVWLSPNAYTSTSVAAGDVDSDGRVDLVFGNEFHPNTLWINQGGAFPSGVFADATAWQAPGAYGTRCVSLGDVDGDSRLDLVAANGPGPNSVFRNLGATFAVPHAWGGMASARAVSLGDVDVDGDLDAAVAYGDAPDALYLNNGGAFDTTPNWTSPPSSASFTVSLGDVDLDGSLDLAIGGQSRQLVLHRHTGRAPLAENGWRTANAASTHAIALGDVDGDGLLDLVRANFGAESVLHRNFSGTLDSIGVTLPGSLGPTNSVVLADFDADGDMDLVTGALRPTGCELRAWDGSGFAVIPAWRADSIDVASVAVGDVDLDGDMDLVCGNFGQANTLYLNDGGALSTAAAWRSEAPERTLVVRLGDLDGDGLLDLVCGNDEDLRVYRNTGGGFADSFAWKTVIANVAAVDLGDVDGDGDLDLMIGSLSVTSSFLIHRNLGDWSFSAVFDGPVDSQVRSIKVVDVNGDGRLDIVTGRTSAVRNRIHFNGNSSWQVLFHGVSFIDTRGLAAGDVDRDGDLDLVFGNRGAPTTVSIGARNPIFLADATTPTGQLANQAASLDSVWVEALGGNTRAVHMSVVDAESDPVWLLARYRFCGSNVWRAAELTDPVNLNGTPLQSSPAGTRVTLRWNTELVPFDPRGLTLRLFVVSNPHRVGIVQHLALSDVAVGTVVAQRPVIELSPLELNFPVMTVGNNASLPLRVTNRGTAALVVYSFEFPSLEMRSEPPAPLIVPPRSTLGTLIVLDPRTSIAIGPTLIVNSNDPLAARSSVDVHADVRALDVDAQLLVSEPVPLGEDLEILVVPKPLVRVQSGRVLFRVSNNDSLRYTAAPLVPRSFDQETGLVTSLVGTIPGSAVIETGLHYYVEVQNGVATATLPPGAPGNAWFVGVLSPESLTSMPRGPVSVGEALDVDVELPVGSVFESGGLHYRPGGAIAYSSLVLSPPDSGGAEGTIPGASVGERGLEYWIEVRTQTKLLVDPPQGGDKPRTVRTTIRRLREDSDQPGGVYRMVSIPMDFEVGFDGTLETLFADQPSFGLYDDRTRWRSFRWSPDTKRYAELESQSKDELHRVGPGRAFWLVSRSPHRVTATRPGQSTRTDEDFEILLSPGWNQIGNPYAFAVDWDAIESSESAVVEPPLRWNGSTPYEETTILEPFDGYFVMNNSKGDVVIRVPPIEVAATSAKSPTTSGKGPLVKNAWRIEIEASSCGLTDMATGGLAQASSAGWDALDRSDPPGRPGHNLSVYFPHDEWRSYSKSYSTDLRSVESATEGGESWQFDISKNFSELDGGDPLALRFEGIDGVPQNLRVVLLDHQLSRETNLREAHEYQLILGKRGLVSEAEARFSLVIGDEQFMRQQRNALSGLPVRTRLLQNQPNPFRRGTLIRYELASWGPVDLLILDVRGRLVRAVRSQISQPGRYELAWDGRDDQGRHVSAGLYFYRLSTPGFSETRKLLVAR